MKSEKLLQLNQEQCPTENEKIFQNQLIKSLNFKSEKLLELNQQRCPAENEKISKIRFKSKVLISKMKSKKLI